MSDALETETKPVAEAKPTPPAGPDVAKLQAELAAAKTEAGHLKVLQSRIATMFDGNSTENQRAEALHQIMVAGGIGTEDAAQVLAQLRAGAEGNPPGEPPPEEAAAAAATADNELVERIKRLEAQSASIEQARAADNRAAAQRELKESISSVFSSNEDAKKFMAAIGRGRTEEDMKKVSAHLEADALRATMERLYARKAQLGFFDRNWIPQEAEKAVAATLEKARAFGATDAIGKTPSGTDELALYAEIAGKKLDPPKYDPKRSSSENGEDVTRFTVGRLQQLAANAARRVPGASKA